MGIGFDVVRTVLLCIDIMLLNGVYSIIRIRIMRVLNGYLCPIYDGMIRIIWRLRVVITQK